jgi:cell division transport system ATP-binding protein
METSIIKLQNAFIFQKEKLVLSDVSFEIQRGEFVYLIGKTGSGKSSLMKTLYADLWLEKGQARVVGFEIEKIKHKEIPFLRRKIGIIFQDFQLLTDRNISQNLKFFMQAMGWDDKKNIQLRIKEVLEMVGLPEVLLKMPHQLSGGEQQRVAIARALLNHPEVLLADEPTGNLDPEKSIEILKLFFKINEIANTAVVMATHELGLIERFPKRTLFCDGGKITDLTGN